MAAAWDRIQQIGPLNAKPIRKNEAKMQTQINDHIH